MPASFPSFTNSFIPSASTTAEITANLVVNYARNKSKFLVNRYATITPVRLPVGFYSRLSAGANIRLNPTSGYGYGWAPGQRRPDGSWNQIGNTRVPYATYRYGYPTQLDLQTVDTADWKIQPTYFNMVATQAMVNRTYQMAAVATNSANYPSLHVSTATALGGGFLDAGTGTAPFLQAAIQNAAIRISKSTGGMVSSPKELMLITNPNGAAKLSRSQEIREYLARQEGAIKVLTGEEPTNAINYNVPDKMYGTELIIEGAVFNSGGITAEDEILNSNFVWPDSTVLICARSDQLVWPEGAVGNPSTLGIFEYEAMNAETKTDSWDRILHMSVSEQFQPQVVAPLTGFLITNAFSS